MRKFVCSIPARFAAHKRPWTGRFRTAPRFSRIRPVSSTPQGLCTTGGRRRWCRPILSMLPWLVLDLFPLSPGNGTRNSG